MSATKCRCGTRWNELEGYLVCPNCDTTQEQEAYSLPRNRTPEDTRYDLYWTHEMREYPDLSAEDEAALARMFR